MLRGKKCPQKAPPTSPTASASLREKQMERDEKESDEIEINVGGDGGAGRRREKKNSKNRTRYDSFLLYSVPKTRHSKRLLNAKVRKVKEENIRGNIHVTS